MKYQLKKYWKLIALLVIATLLFSACDAFASSSKEDDQEIEIPVVVANRDVVVEGNLVPKDFRYLSFAIGGEVVEILVEEGDRVAEGNLLARLGNREQFEAAVAASELELETARQMLEELHENAELASAIAWQALIDANQSVILAERVLDEYNARDFRDELDDAEIAVSDAKDELDDAEDEFKQYINLDEDNPTRKKYEDLRDDAQEKYDEAVRTRDLLKIDKTRAIANLEQVQAFQADAQRRSEALQDSPDPDDLVLAEARVANAEAQLAAAQSALDNPEMRAPLPGTVVELNLILNEQVNASQWVILVADFSEWYVETNDLTELEVVRISEGQVVSIVPDSLPEVELTGRVESISDSFEERLGDITYTARILVDEIDTRLRWGMTVVVRFRE